MVFVYYRAAPRGNSSAERRCLNAEVVPGEQQHNGSYTLRMFLHQQTPAPAADSSPGLQAARNPAECAAALSRARLKPPSAPRPQPTCAVSATTVRRVCQTHVPVARPYLPQLSFPSHSGPRKHYELVLYHTSTHYRCPRGEKRDIMSPKGGLDERKRILLLNRLNIASEMSDGGAACPA